MTTHLNGKTALITGASAGIGEATARLLSTEQVNLILIARRADRLEALKKEFEMNGVDVHLIIGDINNTDLIFQQFENLPPPFQSVDILINNAGLAIGRDKLYEMKATDIEIMVNTNITAVIKFTQKIVSDMVKRNSGHIINMGSIAGLEVYPGGTVYCATKFAMNAISKGLKMDLSGTQIRVSSIDPGMVETEFSLVRFLGDKEKAKAVYEKMIPLKAEDIADAILYVLTRPPHVNINQVVIMPTDQSSTQLVHRHQ